MVWSGLSGNIGHIDCIILVITSKYGIQGSRISRLHLSLFTVYKRVLYIIKLARYYIDMRIIFWIIIKRDRFFFSKTIYTYLYILIVENEAEQTRGGGGIEYYL